MQRRVLFRDAAGAAFLYDATHGELMALPDFAGELSAAAWDAADPRVLAAVSSAGAVHVYCLIPASVQGPGLKLVGTQAAPAAGAVPLALCAGVLTWHLREGPLHSQLLATHQHLAGRPASKPASRTASGKAALHAAAAAAVAAEAALAMSREERLEARCQQALALCHFERALEAASQLGDAELLRQVAASALQFLELPVAIAAYEAAGDAAALAQLRPLLGVEDEQLLAGHIVAITGGEPPLLFSALLWGAGHGAACPRCIASAAAPALAILAPRTRPAVSHHSPQATQTARSSCCWPARSRARPSTCGRGWATGSALWS